MDPSRKNRAPALIDNFAHICFPFSKFQVEISLLSSKAESVALGLVSRRCMPLAVPSDSILKPSRNLSECYVYVRADVKIPDGAYSSSTEWAA